MCQTSGGGGSVHAVAAVSGRRWLWCAVVRHGYARGRGRERPGAAVVVPGLVWRGVQVHGRYACASALFAWAWIAVVVCDGSWAGARAWLCPMTASACCAPTCRTTAGQIGMMTQSKGGDFGNSVLTEVDAGGHAVQAG